MPRKYDRIIRYYSSWFADILDPAKEFSDNEIVQIIIAIKDCQVSLSLEPLEQLPITIRRALSMATMGEQIIRLIETTESARNRGKNGGETAAANRVAAEPNPAAAMRAEQRRKEQRELEARRADEASKAYLPPAALERLRKASLGDWGALRVLGMTQEQAKKNYNEWMAKMSNQK